jgi:pyridoxamine 5'-phosphate oxidase
MVNRDTPIRDKIQTLRKEYQSGFILHEDTVSPDPHDLFSQWFDIAIKAEIIEPNAMVLATVAPDGRPSARVVLMKDLTHEGIGFYSNYQSRKGLELVVNSSAAVVFFWAELERQVRIEGVVAPISREQSEQYFSSRPRGSQLGAASSSQSQVISGREVLELEHARLNHLYQDSSIPCPPHWGGYLLKPVAYEFWQGKENRLHDRLRYRRQESQWLIERLAP